MLNPIGQIYLIIIISNRKTVISKHSALVRRKTPLLTLWGRTAVNLFLPMDRGNPMSVTPSLVLCQHATGPELTWKPLLSNGFRSPIVKEKDFPQTYHGSFLFNWQFHFLEISNKWKRSVLDYFLPKECRECKQNQSERIENIAMLGTLLPGLQEHDFLNMVLQNKHTGAYS